MTESFPRILVVDDEQVQLDTVCRGLTLYGYRCHGVLSVDAALAALAHRCGQHYDLVLTDLTMPGLSGLELIERVRARWPTISIVVATGLAVTAEVADLRRRDIPLLDKPFNPDQLDAAIRKALGRGSQ